MEDYFVYQVAFVPYVDAPILGKIYQYSKYISFTEEQLGSILDEFKSRIVDSLGLTHMTIVYLDDFPKKYYSIIDNNIMQLHHYEMVKFF